MAQETTKTVLTEEQLNDLREVRENFQNLRVELAALGQMELDLNERKAAAAAFNRELRARDQQLGATLQEQYGDVEIDLETGEITTKEN